MALSDDEVEQVISKVEDKQRTEQRTSPLKNISPTQRLMIGVGISVIIWFFFIQNSTLESWQKLFLIVLIGVGIVLLSSYGEGSARLLTDRELVSIAYDLLKWKQDHHLGGEYQIPQGAIKIDVESIPEWRDGKILFWRRRAWIIPTGKLAIEYEIRQDPYNGDLRGMIQSQAGFSGRDFVPKETIYSRDFWRDMTSEAEKKKWTRQK